jgi:hypothetical protein
VTAAVTVCMPDGAANEWPQIDGCRRTSQRPAHAAISRKHWHCCRHKVIFSTAKAPRLKHRLFSPPRGCDPRRCSCRCSRRRRRHRCRPWRPRPAEPGARAATIATEAEEGDSQSAFCTRSHGGSSIAAAALAVAQNNTRGDQRGATGHWDRTSLKEKTAGGEGQSQPDGSRIRS